ncbi:hypothetical protein AVEN_153314-1, partial [Araneus ventricosus]
MPGAKSARLTNKENETPRVYEEKRKAAQKLRIAEAI